MRGPVFECELPLALSPRIRMKMNSFDKASWFEFMGTRGPEMCNFKKLERGTRENADVSHWRVLKLCSQLPLGALNR